MKTRSLVTVGMFAAIICVFAPFTVPVGPIPISLATFAIYLAAAVLGGKKGTAAVAVYILIGSVGIPVFSGFGAGIGKILGVTGGYIVGYIPCAYVAGTIIDRFQDKRIYYPIALILGTAVLYIFGTVWFMFQTGNSLYDSLIACVIPFLIGDAVKIAVASAVSIKLRSYVYREIA